MNNGNYELVSPVPDDDSIPKPRFPKKQGKQTVYPYRNEGGDVLQYVVRHDYDNGKKDFIPYTLWKNLDTGKLEWRQKALPKPRPLYGLDRLAKNPEALVSIHEGEKSADAGQTMISDFVNMTSSGGSKAAGSSDWSVLKGREVCIFGDADKAGKKYIEDIISILKKSEHKPKSLKVVEVDYESNSKRDIADDLEDGVPPSEIYERIRQAKTINLNKINSYNLNQFLSLTLPKRGYLLEPIIKEKSIAMIHAIPGIGKTFLALEIALAIACGGKALKWHAKKPQKVLYIDGEMGAEDIQYRLQKQLIDKDTTYFDNLRIITHDMDEEISLPCLSTKEGQQIINDNLEGVKLIIFDNMSSLFFSINENEAESWTPIQRWIIELKRRGISTLFIHHSGKNNSQRGTSRKEDIMDVILSLKKPSDYSGKDGASFEVNFKKARHVCGDDVEPFEANLSLNGDAKWEIQSIQKKRTTSSEDVEEIIRLKEEGLSLREIELKTGKSKSRVQRILKENE